MCGVDKPLLVSLSHDICLFVISCGVNILTVNDKQKEMHGA